VTLCGSVVIACGLELNLMVQRQTIIHNVSDEPITVEQTDGSHITVPARGKRPAKLPSEMDFLTQSTPQDQPPP
jgi:hypothetical protein